MGHTWGSPMAGAHLVGGGLTWGLPWGWDGGITWRGSPGVEMGGVTWAGGLTWGLPRQAGAEPPHAFVGDQSRQAQPLIHQRLLQNVTAPKPVRGEREGRVGGSAGRGGQPGTEPRRCEERERVTPGGSGTGRGGGRPPSAPQCPHSPCAWPSGLSPAAPPASSSLPTRYGGAWRSDPSGGGSGRLCSPTCTEHTGERRALPPCRSRTQPRARRAVTPTRGRPLPTLTAVHARTRVCTPGARIPLPPPPPPPRIQPRTHLLFEPLGRAGPAVLGLCPVRVGAQRAASVRGQHRTAPPSPPRCGAVLWGAAGSGTDGTEAGGARGGRRAAPAEPLGGGRGGVREVGTGGSEWRNSGWGGSPSISNSIPYVVPPPRPPPAHQTASAMERGTRGPHPRPELPAVEVVVVVQLPWGEPHAWAAGGGCVGGAGGLRLSPGHLERGQVGALPRDLSRQREELNAPQQQRIVPQAELRGRLVDDELRAQSRERQRGREGGGRGHREPPARHGPHPHPHPLGGTPTPTPTSCSVSCLPSRRRASPRP